MSSCIAVLLDIFFIWPVLDFLRLTPDARPMRKVKRPGSVNFESLVQGSASGSLSCAAFTFTDDGVEQHFILPDEADFLTDQIFEVEDVWDESGIEVVAHAAIWAYTSQSLILAFMAKVKDTIKDYSYWQLGFDFAATRSGLPGGIHSRLPDNDPLLLLVIDTIKPYWMKGSLVVEVIEAAVIKITS